MFSIALSANNIDSTQGTPAFRGILTDSSGGMVTATLTSLSEASAVEGTMVECEGESSQEGPLTITVAGEFFMKLLIIQLIYKWTHRSTLPSTERNNILHSKPAQLLYYHSGLGPSLLYWWCVCQLCPHHLPSTSLWVISHRGDHLGTNYCLL